MANNTIVYAEDWTTELQARLSEPTKFKEIANVEYTDRRVLHNPYLTDPTVQTGARGTPYSFQAIVDTDESVTYSTFKIIPQIIDRADLAQTDFPRQMEMADRQSVLLNEAVESGMYADFANWTSFDNTQLGGAAGSVVPSASNIDDICRAIKRKIRKAGGQSLLERNGAFVVWRPEDLEVLEAFAQANGFQTSDAALRGDAGAPGYSGGFYYLGLWHYSSNLVNANHLFAGLKKVYHIGILKGTYGQVVVDDKDPNLISGISVVSRVDFGVKAWNNVKTTLYSIAV